MMKISSEVTIDLDNMLRGMSDSDIRALAIMAVEELNDKDVAMVLNTIPTYLLVHEVGQRYEDSK